MIHIVGINDSQYEGYTPGVYYEALFSNGYATREDNKPGLEASWVRMKRYILENNLFIKHLVIITPFKHHIFGQASSYVHYNASRFDTGDEISYSKHAKIYGRQLESGWELWTFFMDEEGLHYGSEMSDGSSLVERGIINNVVSVEDNP